MLPSHVSKSDEFSVDPLAAFGGVSPLSRGRMNLLSPSPEGETPPKAARGSFSFVVSCANEDVAARDDTSASPIMGAHLILILHLIFFLQERDLAKAFMA